MINDQIVEKMSEFKSLTGKKPKSIYLGEHEQKRMKEWVNHSYGFNYQNLPDNSEFMDCNIYKVKAPSHLNVG